MSGYIATPHHNFKTRTGRLAEGCRLCVKGEKLVLFVTGVCGNGCPYCPVSDQKNLKDVIYANEWNVHNDKELLEEARLMDAKGAGITGGDPLAVIARTEKFIKLLKKVHGKSFHIHLYTPLLQVTEKTLERLYRAGLDEIRFHPRLNDPKDWPRLLLARKYPWSIGVEVPALPQYEAQTKELLNYVKGKVDFVNLNEFEYADNAVFEKAGVHYEPKHPSSYAVKGSAATAKRLLTYAQSLGIAAHFCTAKSKDAVQLARRIKRRARNAAKAFDAVDKEGLLTRGAIYDSLDLTVPDVSRKLQSLSMAEREKSLARLRSLRAKLIKVWGVPAELLFIDALRLRLLTTTSVAQAAAKELNRTVALIKEYPTHDCLIVEAQVLRTRSAR